MLVHSSPGQAKQQQQPARSRSQAAAKQPSQAKPSTAAISSHSLSPPHPPPLFAPLSSQVGARKLERGGMQELEAFKVGPMRQWLQPNREVRNLQEDTNNRSWN